MRRRAWFILAAKPGAKIYLGLDDGVSRDDLFSALQLGKNIRGLLREISVAAGMVIAVPPGTVHAIGAGIVLVEVQSVSGTTYRLFE